MTLKVLEMKGRYPARPRPLKPGNVRAEVKEERPGVFVVRIDDDANEEMWLEIVLVAEATAGE